VTMRLLHCYSCPGCRHDMANGSNVNAIFGTDPISQAEVHSGGHVQGLPAAYHPEHRQESAMRH